MIDDPTPDDKTADDDDLPELDPESVADLEADEDADDVRGGLRGCSKAPLD